MPPFPIRGVGAFAFSIDEQDDPIINILSGKGDETSILLM